MDDLYSAWEGRMTDADLERRQRFDALFTEHVPDIASYCRWRAASVSDGEDAVGEVFLIAWRRLDDVPRGEEARRWLYATARRVMANQARANARRKRLNERLRAERVGSVDAQDPLTRRVGEALAALGPRDREVLLLAEWEGLTAAEIAVVVQRPAVAVQPVCIVPGDAFKPCSSHSRKPGAATCHPFSQPCPWLGQPALVDNFVR